MHTLPGCLLVYQLPAVHERLAWRLANWQAKVQRILNPPEALVFVPGGTAQPGLVETIAKATLDVLIPPITASPPATSLVTQAGRTTQNGPDPTAAVTTATHVYALADQPRRCRAKCC